jgi:hypothetical protein
MPGAHGHNGMKVTVLIGVMCMTLLTLAEVARAGERVWSCGGGYANYVFARTATSGIDTPSTCSVSSGGPGNPAFGGKMSIRSAGKRVARGKHAQWQATAPDGFLITGATVPTGSLAAVKIDKNDSYRGRFYWAGGSRSAHDGQTSLFIGPFASRYFGWQLTCTAKPFCHSNGNRLSVGDIALAVEETTRPALVAPQGLWRASGWVRGDWKLQFYGRSPAGLCEIVASINGLDVASSVSNRNASVWHQCNAQAIDQTIDTAKLGQGAMPLRLGGWDAAGELVGDHKTIYVDNSQPTVTLSGPSDASSVAGTQYVAARAEGSPSGIAGLACSVDGGRDRWYPGAVARVPVAGLGAHAIRCTAENNAVDEAGNHGWSRAAGWSLRIREPTVSAISFENIVTRPHPHVVNSTTRRVAYGRGTTVSGWLGTYRGTGLAHYTVIVLSAPNNGKARFRRAATVTTKANGSWSARLPAGPSQLVEAMYAGGATTEPSWSTQVRTIVPSAISFRIQPRTTHWGGKIHILGRLLGGYIPSPGETVYIHVAVRGLCCDIIHLTSGRRGGFGYTYTFARGSGTFTYRFWAGSVSEADYPYAANRSRVIWVTVR